MIAAVERTIITFDEFIDWYPEQAGQRYELRNGIICEMPKPTGPHSQLAGLLGFHLMAESLRLGLPFVVPKECIVREHVIL